MKKIRIGIIYALPKEYGISIILENLTKNLDDNFEILKIQPKEWPDNTLRKIFIVLKNILKILNPNFKVDVILFSAPLIASSIPALLAKKIRNIPIIAYWDDCFTDFSKVRPKIWELNYWEYKSVKESNKVIVVSDALKELAIKLGRKKEDVYYIPNGVDLELFNPEKYGKYRNKLRKKYGIKNNDIVFGMVSFVYLDTVEKFANEYLDVLSKLISNGITNIKFFFILGGNGVNKFKEIINKSEYSDFVIVHDYVPYKELPKFMSVMDVLLQPVDKSIFTARARSSAKLKLCLAMNILPITVDIGEFSKDLGYGKYGILVRNNEELINGILEYIKNFDKFKNINIREHAKNYDFRILSKKLEKIIFEVIKK